MDQINEKAKQLQNSFTEISNLESKTLGAGVATRSANNVASYMENNTRALKKIWKCVIRNTTTIS